MAHPGQPDHRRPITAQLPGRRGKPLVQRPGPLLRERPVQLLTLLFEIPLVARRPKYCAASVPSSVRPLTLAAMIAAVT